MTTVQIRPAHSSDEAAAVALWRDCGLTVPHNDPHHDFRFARARPGSDVLVAADPAGGAIVGSVMVGHDGHRGWVYYLATAPARRGQGIGRSLMRAAEQWLRERGVAKLQLMVRPTNTEVHAFYERLGFEQAPRTIYQRWIDGR